MSLTFEQEKALKKLGELKVSNYAAYDTFEIPNYECEFDFWWWKTLHEYDLWREGEETSLNTNAAKAAYRWLKKTQYLTTEFQNVKVDGIFS